NDVGDYKYNHINDTLINECEIVTIKLDEDSRRAFRLSILSNETVIESLYFHKTDGLLARSETPVYLTDRDSLKKMCGAKIYKDYKFIKTSFEEYVPDMGDFRFYHNYNRTASLVKLKPEDTFVDTSTLSYNLYAPDLEVVNCKLFVILHPNSIIDKPRIELMRTILMFYNHLDMFFGNFTSPKIRLTLKGILFPDIGQKIPYEGNRLDLQLLNWSEIDKALMKFVKEKKDYFQLDTHDKVYFLSQTSYVREPDGEICNDPPMPRIAAVIHGDLLTYHIIHLQYLAKMFGGQFVQPCESLPGILYHRNRQMNPPLFVWSSCTISGFSTYFNENECSYFNKQRPLLTTAIRDSKDERLRIAIELGVQTRRAYQKNCKIVIIKLDGFNNRSFHLSILSNDSILLESLYLIKTDGLLADSETPVHLMNLQSLKKMLGVVVNEDYRFIKTTIREYVPEMGDFRFYHNYQKVASMCVFFHKTGVQLEGNIGHNILRHLPSEDHPHQNKYIYAKLYFPDLQMSKNTKKISFSNTTQIFNLNSTKLTVVNCKLFIILHPNSIQDKPKIELIRAILMFYNHLDMFFGNFTSPKIRLTLKGILLPDIGKQIFYEGDKHLDLQLTNWSNPDGDICNNLSALRVAAIVQGDLQTYHILHLNYLIKSFGGIDERNDSCPGIMHYNSKWVHPVPLVWSHCSIEKLSEYFNEKDCSWFKKNKPSLSTEIRDPKDDRFRLEIESDVRSRSLYELDEESQVGVAINVTNF
ncbi:Protein of unknown function, partial [Cotesia congregata]